MRVYQEAKQEGEQRGKILALRETLQRQITRKFGSVPDNIAILNENRIGVAGAPPLVLGNFCSLIK